MLCCTSTVEIPKQTYTVNTEHFWTWIKIRKKYKTSLQYHNFLFPWETNIMMYGDLYRSAYPSNIFM